MIRGLSSGTLWMYNAALVVSLIYLLRKYRSEKIILFIVFLFWSGLFADMGKTIQNVFKIATLGYAILLLHSTYRESSVVHGYKRILICLSLYIIYVFTTGFVIHNDGILLMMSQLSKYIIPICLIPFFFNIVEDKESHIELNNVFGEILFIQIVLNIWKLIVIGHWYEGLVGSITGVSGGAVGTTLPLVGLCWICSHMSLSLNKRSIFYIAGLLFIGFMAGKRAVWLQFPILFVILSVFIERKNLRNKLIPIILLSPLLLYFGLRLSPTLNPENKVWGSFNPEYTLNYIMEYSGGTEKYDDNIVAGQGRLGANLLIYDMIFSSENESTWLLSGLGTKYIMAADSENYRDSNYYMGVSNRGALTGFAKTFLAYGIVGLLLFVIFLISVIMIIPDLRIRIIMGGMLLFDFFFYNSTMCSNIAIFTFFLYTALSLSEPVNYDFEEDDAILTDWDEKTAHEV